MSRKLLAILYLLLSHISCIPRRFYISLGQKSRGWNDAISTATCREGYIGETCQCKLPNECDGSVFVNETCRVYNHELNVFGSQAEITCVPKEHDNMKYIDIKPPRTKRPTATCPKGSTLVNCALVDFHRRYNDPLPTVSGSSCLAPAGVCLLVQSCIMQIRCKVDYCGDPGDVPHSTRTGDFYVNDTVTYLCDGGLLNRTKVIKCLPGYGWDSKPPDCSRTTPRVRAVSKKLLPTTKVVPAIHATAVSLGKDNINNNNSIFSSSNITAVSTRKEHVARHSSGSRSVKRPDMNLSDSNVFLVASGVGLAASFSGLVMIIIAFKKQNMYTNRTSPIRAHAMV